MDTILNPQINFILFIQPYLYPFFLKISKILIFFAGNFFILLLPVIFWSINRKVGKELIYLFIASLLLAWSLKEITHISRPFLWNSDIKHIPVSGYSFPSADALIAVVMYGFLIGYLRNIWMSIILVLLISLICVSRIILGVHFPTDVLGGIILGILVLWIYFNYAKDKLITLHDKINRKGIIFLSLTIPPLLSLFYYDRIPIEISGLLSGFLLGSTFLDNEDLREYSKICKIISTITGLFILLLINFGMNEIHFLEDTSEIYIKGFLMGCWLYLFIVLRRNVYNTLRASS